MSRAVYGGEHSEHTSASRPIPVLVLLETSLSLKSYQGYFKPECNFILKSCDKRDELMMSFLGLGNVSCSLL